MVQCFLGLWIFSVHLEWPSFCSDPPDLARPLHGTVTQPGPARGKKKLFDYNYSVKYFGNIFDVLHLCFLHPRFCRASRSSLETIDAFRKEAISEYRTKEFLVSKSNGSYLRIEKEIKRASCYHKPLISVG